MSGAGDAKKSFAALSAAGQASGAPAPADRLNRLADDLLGELRRGGKGTLKEILIRLDRPATPRAQHTASRAMVVLADRGLVSRDRTLGVNPVWEAVAEPPKAADRSQVTLDGLDATVVVATLHRKYPVARVEVRAEVAFGDSWPKGTRVPGLTLGLTLSQAAAPGALAAAQARAVEVQSQRVAALRGVPAPALALPPPDARRPPRRRSPPPAPPAALPSTSTPIPTPPPAMAQITPALRRDLIAQAATVQGGARAETLHLWLRQRKIERAASEELLDELVAEGQLERIELVVAGADVVRYRPADPSTKPAPLPKSDAPAAELAAPAQAPEEPQAPAPPSPAPADAPPAVPSPPAEAPTPTEPVKEPEPASGEQDTAEPPRKLYGARTALAEPAPAPVQPTPEWLAAAIHALPADTLARLAEEKLDIAAEQNSLSEAQADLDRRAAELARDKAEVERRRTTLAQRQAHNLTVTTALLREALPGLATALPASPEPLPRPAPVPAPSKAPAPPPKPLAKAPAPPANDDSERPVAERVLLAVSAGEKVRASDVAARLPSVSQHAISSAMSALSGKGLLERVEFGVYKLTQEGAAEQRRLRQRSAA